MLRNKQTKKNRNKTTFYCDSSQTEVAQRYFESTSLEILKIKQFGLADGPLHVRIGLGDVADEIFMQV